jgi:hypothetical protein
MSISIWDYEKPLDAMRLSHDHMAALVLKHEQQIKDLAAHLLEIKQLVTPMREFKPAGTDAKQFAPPSTLQEPVAWLVTYGGLTHVEYTPPTQVGDTHYQPLYTSQKREWVGLTGDEKHDCYLKIDVWSRCVEAVEAKLREKNGG